MDDRNFIILPTDAADTLQLEAGVVLTEFNPANPRTPTNDEILAVTSGGVSLSCVPQYSDLFEDVDNAANDTLEGNHLDGWESTGSFTSIRFNEQNTKWALGAADIEEKTGYREIVPRKNVKREDYKTLWWVAPIANGGLYYVKMENVLSTGGLSVQSTKNGKGTMSMSLKAFTSVAQQQEPPMKAGVIDPPSDSTVYSIVYDLIGATSSEDDTTVEKGGSYSTTLTAGAGLELDEVKVTMGGVDVTGLVYDESTGEISIGAVTGGLIITATTAPTE